MRWFRIKFRIYLNRNNDKDERLFQLLQKAYIDTRYKESFQITSGDINILIEKIKTLQDIMKVPL